ncbi:hypothetical protein JOC37_001334 [Desulfohalotomaculum tongense]|uniref:Athe_2463 domain-containing protein n=1 Tax=Desulforadius tongensis TaxID=1216062 RepID=UPI0019578971|nr:hypothetical protein [Desulforadius tongensis]MBM7854954.1 hypothetical protein [Desulforadius tongensis]
MPPQNPPQNIDEALKEANDELKARFGVIDYFREYSMGNKYRINDKIDKEHQLWANRRIFVYGKPFDFDSDTGNHRYLGYTINNEAFTNIFFRHDNWAGGCINSRNWIKWPWKNPDVEASLKARGEPLIHENDFDGKPELRDSIIEGLKAYAKSESADRVPIPFNPNDDKPWHEYVHVLVPPTQYTWGMGRMWHQSGGSVWYLTIPLAPVAQSAPDFSVVFDQVEYNDIQPGAPVEGTVRFKLAEGHTKPETAKLTLVHEVGGNEWPVRLTAINPADSLPSNGVIEFKPGEEKAYKFKVTAQSEGTTLIVRVNPVTSEDINWENNRDEAIINILKPLAPVVTNSKLTFQAVSQDKTITRPANTAKWTDWVTATLKPSAPTPPKGKLVSWEITSASITYPKKNPRFTFGNPLPPKGTTTINMNPNGHKATATFQEDWAMDGARIYNPIKDKLMAKYPKKYTLTANYTIHYVYQYKVRHRSCHTSNGHRHCHTWYETVTKSGTVSDSVSGVLLVNGSGVNSRAQ